MMKRKESLKGKEEKMKIDVNKCNQIVIHPHPLPPLQTHKKRFNWLLHPCKLTWFKVQYEEEEQMKIHSSLKLF